MINLLPPEQRREIRAGYSNTLLVRYTTLSIAALVFMLAALGITYLVLTQSQRVAEATQAENQAKAAGFHQVQAEANSLRNDLSSVKSLFDNEILYSKALTNLADALPNGTAIDSLELSPASFSSPTTLNIKIRDRAAAEALESNLSSSPHVSGVALGSISTSSEDGQYPYSVSVTLTLNRSMAQ